MHTLLEHYLHPISHAITRLAIHDEDAQQVYFEEGKEEQIQNKNIETTLTAYFK